MKIVTVVGARPQFIKAAPVSEALRLTGIHEHIIHTGQHYDPAMSQIFFTEMGIPAPFRLLSSGGLSHAKQTAEILVGVEDALNDLQPDGLLVYGDTNSTLAGALAAAKLHVPVIHIEAGLRSFNMKMPEEINRIMTDHVSSLLFCPTELAFNNLIRENLDREKLHVCGDVMVDATEFFSRQISSDSEIRLKESLDLKGPYWVCTIHRAENTDNPSIIKNIVDFIGNLSESFEVVMPIHPRTEKIIASMELKIPPGIKIIPPVGYIDMLTLMKNSSGIVTDSGGIQKEAYVLGKPCVTLRSETEWLETIDIGANTLIDPSLDIKSMIEMFNNFVSRYTNPAKGIYGDGQSSKKIAEIISERLKNEL